MDKTTVLPLKCTANYTPGFLSETASKKLYDQLIGTYRIENLKTKIGAGNEAIFSDYGKIMFMDKNLYEGNKLPESQWEKTAVWSDELMLIKERVETFAKRKFHVCVCIYYPDGNSGVDYHSDYVAFGDTSVIPSISLGEERTFCLREKATFDVFEIVLQKGSLIVIGENCQQLYEHSLPVDSKYKNGRINLTFRQFGL